jgi:hypothetical protein
VFRIFEDRPIPSAQVIATNLNTVTTVTRLTEAQEWTGDGSASGEHQQHNETQNDARLLQHTMEKSKIKDILAVDTYNFGRLEYNKSKSDPYFD